MEKMWADLGHLEYIKTIFVNLKILFTTSMYQGRTLGVLRWLDYDMERD